jgi:hypothetical protein
MHQRKDIEVVDKAGTRAVVTLEEIDAVADVSLKKGNGGLHKTIGEHPVGGE